MWISVTEQLSESQHLNIGHPAPHVTALGPSNSLFRHQPSIALWDRIESIQIYQMSRCLGVLDSCNSERGVACLI